MKLVNRSVLVLKPTAKMLDWINSMGEESAAVTPEEAQEMTNACLLPDFEDDEERHLRHGPGRVSRSRIKRLRGINHPQYRLRVGEIRVSYDITENTVEVLAIVSITEATSWLGEMGE